jgi:hypothetical protein
VLQRRGFLGSLLYVGAAVTAVEESRPDWVIFCVVMSLIALGLLFNVRGEAGQTAPQALDAETK